MSPTWIFFLIGKMRVKLLNFIIIHKNLHPGFEPTTSHTRPWIFSMAHRTSLLFCPGADPLCTKGPLWILKNNIFGNLPPLPPGNLFAPLDCLINFIEKKIFNIAHNEIIIQRYQNIKIRKRKLSSSTWLSISLRFILLLFLIYKILLFLYSIRLVNEFEPNKEKNK
jgi:hypothetical protein